MLFRSFFHPASWNIHVPFRTMKLKLLVIEQRDRRRHAPWHKCCGTWTLIRERNRLQIVYTTAITIFCHLWTNLILNPSKYIGANSKSVMNNPLFFLDTSSVNKQVLFKIFTLYSCKKYSILWSLLNASSPLPSASLSIQRIRKKCPFFQIACTVKHLHLSTHPCTCAPPHTHTETRGILLFNNIQ